MPNHFHFLVKIKSEEEITLFFKEKSENNNQIGFENLSGLISKQFSNLFNSYAKALNKQQNRTGSLFQRGFKRKEINSDLYLKELVLYIHCNAVHHGFVHYFEDWKYTSYHNLKAGGNKVVIKWFDDLSNFVACHQDKNEFNKIKNFVIE
jgi:REP element-mobilizing transposase RayT